MPRRDQPDHPLLPLFIPVVQIPQGDGSVLIKPGRPVEWLTPKQFALQVGLSADTIRRKIGTPALPMEFVEYTGPRKIRIRADALSHWRAHWAAMRDGGML